MILLFSSNDDYSTNLIIDWLEYYQIEWIRLNESDYLKVKKIHIANDKTEIILVVNDSFELDFSCIKFVWHRRGGLNIEQPKYHSINNEVYKQISDYLIRENSEIKNFLYQYLYSNCRYLIKYTNIHNKKMEYVLLAKKSGLNVPETLIANNFNHFEENNNYITKSINEGIGIWLNDYTINNKTTQIDSLKNYQNENFNNSLFQKYVNKIFELRIYFHLHDFFAMAIFSQQNEKTKVDFRNYDYEKPNRKVPFNIPLELKQKLMNFIALIDLKTGSIDMIYSTNKEFVFLEVNPVGQFGMVSFPCNYYIEKKIVKLFCSHD
jgi:ATP-GRASP peptide maturase of grasp-with-spasm system